MAGSMGSRKGGRENERWVKSDGSKGESGNEKQKSEKRNESLKEGVGGMEWMHPIGKDCELVSAGRSSVLLAISDQGSLAWNAGTAAGTALRE